MKNGTVSVNTITIESQLYHGSTPVLHYKIQYPQFINRSHQRVLNRINKTYKKRALLEQIKAETLMYCEALHRHEQAVKDGYEFAPTEVLMVFDVTYNQDCVLSLYVDRYQFTGGAHGITEKEGDTWNIESGYRISLDQVLLPLVDVKEFILSQVLGQISVQIASGDDWYFENPIKLASKYFNCKNFYLIPEGIIFFYSLYEIAPYASGFPQFLIPFDEECVSRPFCCKCW